MFHLSRQGSELTSWTFSYSVTNVKKRKSTLPKNNYEAADVLTQALGVLAAHSWNVTVIDSEWRRFGLVLKQWATCELTFLTPPMSGRNLLNYALEVISWYTSGAPKINTSFSCKINVCNMPQSSQPSRVYGGSAVVNAYEREGACCERLLKWEDINANVTDNFKYYQNINIQFACTAINMFNGRSHWSWQMSRQSIAQRKIISWQKWWSVKYIDTFKCCY